MDKIKMLKEMIKDSKNIVAFTGAGVSTGSGIKDFRGVNGLGKESKIPLEILLSSDYFYDHTKEFYEFYKRYFNPKDIEVNVVHKYLKKLEDEGKLVGVVTQNIDGLHRKAGSKNVYELHGTTFDNHCIKCFKEYDYKKVFEGDGIPHCDCGGIIKPNVVLYGEQLPEDVLHEAIQKIVKADMLLVLGSSLVVYPAAGLIDYFCGKYLVIINDTETQYDSFANLVINDDLIKVFKELL